MCPAPACRPLRYPDPASPAAAGTKVLFAPPRGKSSAELQVLPTVPGQSPFPSANRRGPFRHSPRGRLSPVSRLSLALLPPSPAPRRKSSRVNLLARNWGRIALPNFPSRRVPPLLREELHRATFVSPLLGGKSTRVCLHSFSPLLGKGCSSRRPFFPTQCGKCASRRLYTHFPSVEGRAIRAFFALSPLPGGRISSLFPRS